METGDTYSGNSQQTGTSWQSDPQRRAEDLAEEAKRAARERAASEAEHGMRSASAAVTDSASALEQAARTLDEQGQRTLAQTTSSIASGLSDFARRMEEGSPEELVRDIAGLARRNPQMYILGGIGAGLILSRFFKASSDSSGRTS
ncbi:MAG: hypothetical protein ACOCVV_08670 [Marinobacter sp.]